jgi:tripartite-type tricarboxylate transporter receptor subunit TctC
MATSTTLAMNKTLYKKLPYDPVKDFTPIALVAAVPFALIVNPQLPSSTSSNTPARVSTLARITIVRRSLRMTGRNTPPIR